jgi:hypothetical protein
MGKTGQLFVPKVADSRKISLEILVRDNGTGIARVIFDQFAVLFADRTQGALANILDSGTRSGTAEVVQWLPQDMGVGGTVFKGIVDFNLAYPWLSGVTVSGNVIPGNTVIFSTPVSNNFSSRSSYTLVVSSVTSGQPIFVGSGCGGHNVSSISDNFSTPYSWTQVEHTTQSDLWIGTGGVGSSGTITVTYGGAYLIGGFAVSCVGASTSAGLGAVDVHQNTTGSSSPCSITCQATATGEGMVATGYLPSNITSGPPAPWIDATATYYTATLGGLATYSSAPNGSALTATWTVAPASSWGLSAAIVKGAGGGGAASLTLTNPGTVIAENMTIDILGPIVDPQIVNTTNGVSLSYAGTVSAATHLVIDTGAYTVLNNGANSVGYLAHSGAMPFMTLLPGANVLSVSGASATGSSLVTVTFAAPYE